MSVHQNLPAHVGIIGSYCSTRLFYLLTLLLGPTVTNCSGRQALFTPTHLQPGPRKRTTPDHRARERLLWSE